MEYGEFLVRTNLSENCVVQQRIYAHRNYKNILVHDISLLENQHCESVSLELSVNEGAPSDDISFLSKEEDDFIIYSGEIKQTETRVSNEFCKVL